MKKENKNIILGMPNAEYHARPENSNTNLGWVYEWSPYHYYVWKFETDPPDPTPKMIKGQAVHTAVLEPDAYEQRFVSYDGYRRGKAWDAFREEHSDKEILKPEDYKDALAIREAIMEHPAARRLIEQIKWVEVSVFAELMGIECKARPDIWTFKDTLADLKSTSQSARPDKWAASIERYCYDRQAAFQHDVVAKAMGEYIDLAHRKYYWIVVESSFPYAVSVLECPPEMLLAGRQSYQQILEEIRKCREEDSWPGYSSHIMAAHYPKWSKKGGEIYG